MKFAAIITSALVIFSATTSMAAGCSMSSGTGRFKNTVPPAKSVATTVVKTTTKTGAR